MSPPLTSLPTSSLTTAAPVRSAKAARPAPAQSFSRHLQAVPARQGEDKAALQTPREALPRAAGLLEHDSAGMAPVAPDLSADNAPAAAPDGQALDAVRQSEARAFGFAELGVLGRGFGAGGGATSIPGPAVGASPQAAAPSAPASEPTAWLLAEVASRPLSSHPILARAPVAAVAAAQIRDLDATSVARASVAELEAPLDLSEPGAEETSGPGAMVSRGPAPRARGSQASVIVAQSDGVLQVLVGAARLSADEETALRQRIEEAVADLGGRLGEVQVNGRALARRGPRGRQG